jgi:hypothetical protein
MFFILVRPTEPCGVAQYPIRPTRPCRPRVTAACPGTGSQNSCSRRMRPPRTRRHVSSWSSPVVFHLARKGFAKHVRKLGAVVEQDGVVPLINLALAQSVDPLLLGADCAAPALCPVRMRVRSSAGALAESFSWLQIWSTFGGGRHSHTPPPGGPSFARDRTIFLQKSKISVSVATSLERASYSGATAGVFGERPAVVHRTRRRVMPLHPHDVDRTRCAAANPNASRRTASVCERSHRNYVSVHNLFPDCRRRGH